MNISDKMKCYVDRIFNLLNSIPVLSRHECRLDTLLPEPLVRWWVVRIIRPGHVGLPLLLILGVALLGHGGGHKEGDYEALHPGFGERKY